MCLYMHVPREPHFFALKRIFGYVRGTLDYGLQLFSSSTTDLVAYLDADWAGCPTTRNSTLGYYVFLGNNLTSYSSKLQPMLSRSSAEAEDLGVANAVAETCWLRNLLRELYTPLSSDTLVYCDNISVVYLSCNQFWAPVKIRERQLLSTYTQSYESAQIGSLILKYRLLCVRLAALFTKVVSFVVKVSIVSSSFMCSISKSDLSVCNLDC
nr:ribonuclease H-like domain-containing protein [Tanacetum cinerariifolium]